MFAATSTLLAETTYRLVHKGRRHYDHTVSSTPEDFYANALAHADDEGRMALSNMTGWEIFPFEREGLRVVPLAAPELPEEPRNGEGGSQCRSCASSHSGTRWQNDRWRLITLAEPSGAPLVMMIQPKAHHDLVDLPDDLAAELGRLIVHVARAVESLPHIARAHVSRWGDGGAHLHLFVLARPTGFPQLRGTCFAIWDDLLSPVPRSEWDADAHAVAVSLARSFGGSVLSSS
jgi:diadenosine tetraphosphate (Ap4A) HIT family hydrolase